MAYTTIDDPSAHFYTYAFSKSSGTGSATFDGNSDLQPDFLWVKSRTNADSHELWDSTRGVNSTLFSDSPSAEDTAANRIVSFDTDGFTWGNAGNLNAAGDFVSWAWKANAGSTSSNTDGSITSTVQVNSDAGLSIVTFTGNGSNNATIGHGLGVTPAFIITKNLSDTVSWRTWHKDLTSTYMLFINSNNAETSPTSQGNGYIKTVGSSTYSVYQGTTNTNGVNGSGDSMVSYCFAEKQGFSKFSKYKANGATNGTFSHTGFRPAFLIIKDINGGAGGTTNFIIWDSKRSTYNPNLTSLNANLSGAEFDATAYSNIDIDVLSNGFKIRHDSGKSFLNMSGRTYIFMAFAENPFVTSTGIPTTAR
jgi:hypothetical protein